MRKIITFLFVMTFASFCFAQSARKDTIPFKNAEKILVRNNLSKFENFNLVKSILSEQEIELANSDQGTGQVKTGTISIDNKLSSAANYFIIIFCKENEVSMRSQFKPGISSGGLVRIEDGYQPVKYFNLKKGNVIFDKMKEIAMLMNGKVYYSN